MSSNNVQAFVSKIATDVALRTQVAVADVNSLVAIASAAGIKLTTAEAQEVQSHINKDELTASQLDGVGGGGDEQGGGKWEEPPPPPGGE